MSERLTSRWTESLDEAFGFTGKKGRLGEEFMCNVFESWGWDYKHFPDDKKKQLSGIDIEFKNPEWRKFYSCDVKNNMNEYGVFYVEKKWLFKTKADRIFHVNPDTGWIAWYSVDDMREWFSGDYDLVKLIPSKTPKFVKRTKVEAKWNICND